MATLTLAQHQEDEKQPLRKGMLMGLIQEGLAHDIIPWRQIPVLEETGVRYDEVFTPDWVPMDGTITSGTADGSPLAYSVYKMAKHVDIPLELERSSADKLAKDSATQLKLLTKGFAYSLNDAAINGDQGSDANQMQGLNYLVSQLGATQTYNPAALALAAVSAGEAETLFEVLEEGMWRVDGHMPDAAFADAALLKKIEHAARVAGYRGNDFDWLTSPYTINDPRRTLNTKSNRPAFMFRKVPFYDLGVLADQSTRVIGSTYNEGNSSGSTGTRVFMVKFGEDQLEGLEFTPFQIEAINGGKVLEDKDVLRWRARHVVGLAAWGPRCIVKITGIEVAV